MATLALKAVRYQKFNEHLRLRPEALAARIEKFEPIKNQYPSLGPPLEHLKGTIGPTLKAVKDRSEVPELQNALLPMAFQEGSPMHPSYGAGHATVAGACVTMLKAFFDTKAVFVNVATNKKDHLVGLWRVREEVTEDEGVAFVQDESKDSLFLSPLFPSKPLTLEGELNKLAANISIGRNMAGVHYFSDYCNSLQMGERVAIGILEEQALCYRNDEFKVELPSFDGKCITIDRTGVVETDCSQNAGLV